MPETRKDTAFWLLGDPESLKFWPDSDKTDEDGRSIPACPDVSGKMLPTQLQAPRSKIKAAERLCNLWIFFC